MPAWYAALEHGHTVFVEKPLALTEDQLEAVLETVERTGNDRVMVGFNRRLRLFLPICGNGLVQPVGRSRLAT